MSKPPTTPSAVELTHRAYEALNARDLDALASLLSPSCVCDVSCWELGIHQGPEAITAFAENWLGSLYEYGAEVEDMQDLGSGVTYVTQVAHRAHTRHGYIELPAAAMFVWAHGKLRQLTVYADNDAAYRAAQAAAAGASAEG